MTCDKFPFSVNICAKISVAGGGGGGGGEFCMFPFYMVKNQHMDYIT